ncbi:hypothetical protein AQUCO_01100145v1 [Aquilegia coerulea]|uniref:Uncharacterized protein n=1 Tax=Aquilegia coerulea TaxID=218851 RepID=A0A2G5E5S3_AQUCA|nr:hypothetical protein AQUCO_01100145v1 [Aquilegia coerulea]
MTKLWDELALTESDKLRTFTPYISHREEQRLVQFLMALRDDFEGLRGSILHRNFLPSVDSVVNELLAEEVRLKPQVGKGLLPLPTSSVMDVPYKSSFKSPSRHHPKVADDEYSFCKQTGHWKLQCPLLLSKANDNQSRSKMGKPSSHRTSKPRHTQSNAATSDGANSVDSFNQSLTTQLAEQFQKFLTTHPSAMSTSMPIGLSSSTSSGSSIQEADWDRP